MNPLALLGMGWDVLGSPLAGRLGAVGLVAVGFLAVGQCTAKESAQREAARLSEAIHKPVTGWAARLTQCQQNERILGDELADQSAAVTKQADEANRRVAAAAELAAQAQKGRAKAERSAAGLTALVKDFGAGPSVCTDPDLAAIDAAVLGATR